MSIDPKILAQMGKATVMTALRGSPKQIKWATTIRDEALALSWPPEVEAKLKQIADSTWWIANKTLVHTMKFKEPALTQMAGAPMTNSTATGSALQQPDLGHQTSQAPAAPSTNSRMVEAAAFAASVSQMPDYAEAAILAVFYRLYKEPVMKASLRAAALAALEKARRAAPMVIANPKDVDAIKRLLDA